MYRFGHGLDRKIPDSGKRLFSSPEFPDWLWGPSSFFCSKGAKGSFPRDKSTGVWGWPRPSGVGVNEWSNTCARSMHSWLAWGNSTLHIKHTRPWQSWVWAYPGQRPSSRNTTDCSVINAATWNLFVTEYQNHFLYSYWSLVFRCIRIGAKSAYYLSRVRMSVRLHLSTQFLLEGFSWNLILVSFIKTLSRKCVFVSNRTKMMVT